MVAPTEIIHRIGVKIIYFFRGDYSSPLMIFHEIICKQSEIICNNYVVENKIIYSIMLNIEK